MKNPYKDVQDLTFSKEELSEIILAVEDYSKVQDEFNKALSNFIKAYRLDPTAVQDDNNANKIVE